MADVLWACCPRLAGPAHRGAPPLRQPGPPARRHQRARAHLPRAVPLRRRAHHLPDQGERPGRRGAWPPAANASARDVRTACSTATVWLVGGEFVAFIAPGKPTSPITAEAGVGGAHGSAHAGRAPPSSGATMPAHQLAGARRRRHPRPRRRARRGRCPLPPPHPGGHRRSRVKRQDRGPASSGRLLGEEGAARTDIFHSPRRRHPNAVAPPGSCRSVARHRVHAPRPAPRPGLLRRPRPRAEESCAPRPGTPGKSARKRPAQRRERRGMTSRYGIAQFRHRLLHRVTSRRPTTDFSAKNRATQAGTSRAMPITARRRAKV